MKTPVSRSCYFLAALALLVSGCDEPENPELPKATAAYLAYAKGKVDIEGGLIKLAGSNDGIITEVNAEEGDHVKKGTVLAVVDDREPKLRLAIAEAEIAETRALLPALELRQRSAAREVSRLTRLSENAAVSQLERDEAKDRAALLDAEQSQIEARIRLAEARRDSEIHAVDQRRIRAPLDGRIIKRQARPGDGVSTQTVTSLFLFEPDSPRIIRAELDERYVDLVRPGAAVEVMLEMDETKVFAGTVLRVGQVFGTQQLSGDPNEKADQRVVDCVISMNDQSLRIGQRVLVRVPKISTTRLLTESSPKGK
jgi:HlyD family secretion protein